MASVYFPTNDLARVYTFTNLFEKTQEATTSSNNNQPSTGNQGKPDSGENPLPSDGAQAGPVVSSPLPKNTETYTLNDMVSNRQLNTLKSFAPLFKEAYNKVNALNRQKREATDNAANVLEQLSTVIRDAWVVMRRRINRKGYPSSLLTYYLIPESHQMKVSGSREYWIQVARDVLDGDTAAVAKGFPPMLDPGADEIRERLAEAEKAIREVQEMGVALKRARQEFAELRERSGELYRDLANTARFYLREHSHSHIRDIMRDLGFKVRTSNPAESEEPEVSEGENEILSIDLDDALPQPQQ